MKKNIIFTIIVVCLFGNKSLSQQLPYYSQFYYNPFVYNPGFAGIGENPKAFLLHRSQWKNIQGAPVTYGLTIDGKTNQEKMRLGLSIFNDQTDIFNRTFVGASYAYSFQVGGDHYIIPGITVGFNDNRIDFSASNPKDVNDPLLISASRRKITPDAAFGIAYHWNNLKAGIAAKQLFGNQIAFENKNQNAYFRLKQHLVFNVMYDYEINDELSVVPNASFFWSQNSPLQFDVGAIVRWRGMIQGGPFFRYNYAAGMNLGLNLFDNLFLSYSYEYMLLAIGAYTGGGHEIALGYTFGGNSKKYIDEKLKEINDDLDQRLLNTQEKIEEQQRKNLKQQQEIDSLKEAVKNLPKTTGSVNSTNTSPSEAGQSIKKENRQDYTDETGATVSPGFYVVIESFQEKANADKAKEYYMTQTDFIPAIIYNKKRKFYYVSVMYTPDESEARKKLEEARQVRKDAWIFLFD